MKWALMAILAAVPSNAAAECAGASLTSFGTLPVVQYDPFDSGNTSGAVDVQIDLPEDRQDCKLGLSIAGLTPGSSRRAMMGNAEIIYRLFLDGREIVDNPDAVVQLEQRHLDSGRVEIRIEVPGGQVGLAGLYADAVTFRLLDLEAGEARLGPERQASVNVAMESRAQVNLAGSDIGTGSFGLARLDFGALRQGDRRSARVQVRSTAPVTINIRSQNGGAMERVAGGGDKIAYLLTFDGANLALASGPATLTKHASPGLAGSSYALDVTISGNPDTLPAGDYRDLVTVDVDPS